MRHNAGHSNISMPYLKLSHRSQTWTKCWITLHLDSVQPVVSDLRSFYYQIFSMKLNLVSFILNNSKKVCNSGQENQSFNCTNNLSKKTNFSWPHPRLICTWILKNQVENSSSTNWIFSLQINFKIDFCRLHRQ